MENNENGTMDINLTDSIDSIEKAVSDLEVVVDAIVIKHSKELDDYIEYVKAIVDDDSKPITVTELEDMVLTIPTLLYFLGDAQELLGVHEDIAKMDKINKYNSVVSVSAGTVQAKQAVAELKTKNEALVHIVFQRARKRLQNKYEMAFEVLQSVKKILSRRVAELELSKNMVDRQTDRESRSVVRFASNEKNRKSD